MKEELGKMFDEYLAKNGLRMCKLLSDGFWGATYDRRQVFSRAQIYKLNEEGFRVEEDMGAFTFNINELNLYMKKNDKIKIKQICAAGDGGSWGSKSVFGLGDDNRVYIWRGESIKSGSPQDWYEYE